MTWFFTLFSAASIKDRVHFLTGVQYLYDFIGPDQLEMPPFVLEYDLQVCVCDHCILLQRFGVPFLNLRTVG